VIERGCHHFQDWSVVISDLPALHSNRITIVDRENRLLSFENVSISRIYIFQINGKSKQLVVVIQVAEVEDPLAELSVPYCDQV
jgi:hypothetical protein